VLHRLRQAHGGHNNGPGANPGLVPVIAVQPVSTAESTDSTTAASITSSSVVVSTSATLAGTSSASGLAIASTSSDTTSMMTKDSTASASATSSTSSDTKIVITDYTTVKWYESWVGGTYSTWFPTTITVHPAFLTPAPRPGKGEIGMGTLTGELGGTSLGAAPSQAPGWKGIAAAAGVGIVGMVV
jgi:hypothetical protein